MSSGIQSLLKTEKEAAEIVNEARKYRTNRLKTAKQDAQQEIENYKKQKEADLKKYEQEHEGINEKIDKEADAEVEKELKDLKKQFTEKKQSVIKLLVDATITPNPQLHINAGHWFKRNKKIEMIWNERNEMRLNRINWGRTRSNQVNPGQSRANNFKFNQIKLIQIKLDQTILQ